MRLMELEANQVLHKIIYIEEAGFNLAKSCEQFTGSHTANEAEDLDDPTIWEDIGKEAIADMESSHQQHLQCFAHTLQLVVRDGLKETNTLTSQISKTLSSPMQKD
ncbi:hypothetical protein DPEC_G00071460 [Dallia pectoralis]|uniref:Uncharacterized protein n=1 Tax=Dallia pectoralis TaxID=75939 RepID=A0ACC2H2D6_DALPE|nr:hypothetical protein DPEC_G00071460 [Dallia pectoralis]